MSEGLFGLFGGGAADPWAATTTLDPERSWLEHLRFNVTGSPHGNPALGKAVGDGIGQVAKSGFKSPFASSEKTASAPAPAAPPPPQIDAAAAMAALKPPPPAAAGKKDKFGGIYGQSPFGPGPT